jgi:hypothetical protein
MATTGDSRRLGPLCRGRQAWLGSCGGVKPVALAGVGEGGAAPTAAGPRRTRRGPARRCSAPSVAASTGRRSGWATRRCGPRSRRRPSRWPCETSTARSHRHEQQGDGDRSQLAQTRLLHPKPRGGLVDEHDRGHVSSRPLTGCCRSPNLVVRLGRVSIPRGIQSSPQLGHKAPRLEGPHPNAMPALGHTPIFRSVADEAERSRATSPH